MKARLDPLSSQNAWIMLENNSGWMYFLPIYESKGHISLTYWASYATGGLFSHNVLQTYYFSLQWRTEKMDRKGFREGGSLSRVEWVLHYLWASDYIWQFKCIENYYLQQLTEFEPAFRFSGVKAFPSSVRPSGTDSISSISEGSKRLS